MLYCSVDPDLAEVMVALGNIGESTNLGDTVEIEGTEPDH